MNIFVTDPCPLRSAENLDDLRLNKMILETGQMLSTAIQICAPQLIQWKYLFNEKKQRYEYYPHLYGCKIPKRTHENHPCTVWTRLNNQNFRWLYQHLTSLCIVFEYRRKKKHSYDELYQIFRHLERNFPQDDKTPFAIAINWDQLPFGPTGNTITDYRRYMCHKWKHDKRPPKWTGQKRPSWCSDDFTHINTEYIYNK